MPIAEPRSPDLQPAFRAPKRTGIVEWIPREDS